MRSREVRYPESRGKVRFHALGRRGQRLALGFVFDQEQFDRRIRPLLARKVNPFLVASFDFGGGSVDYA